MQINLHQSHHTIGDFDQITNYLFKALESTDGLHLFPELFLTGYPLQDLCLEANFRQNYASTLQKINDWSEKQAPTKGKVALIGGLYYHYQGDKELPSAIENVIFELVPGSPLKKIYTKQLLPSYDIFDEQKYFKAGTESVIWQWNEQQIGLLVCEDMWPSSHYPSDPVHELAKKAPETGLDFVVNLSASPYHLGKNEKRNERALEIVHTLGCPFAYVNRVGHEDEILFDGGSFIMDRDGKMLCGGQYFAADQYQYQLEQKNSSNKTTTELTQDQSNSWESLFSARVDSGKPASTLRELSDLDCAEILAGLKFALQDYANKCGFKNFLVANSGGIDSALVLTIAKLALKEGQHLEAVFMPGLYSSSLSYELSDQLCKNLAVAQPHLPIKFLHSTVKNTYRGSYSEELTGLADENIQSRLRGALLYARSNAINAMVINTSNKSELAVGYSTLYGDSVGAISLLGDLYKSEVFRLAQYINEQHGELIPTGIIERPPSAELREDQKDQDSLPAYETLDPLLECMLSYQYSLTDLVALGFSEDDIALVDRLYTRSEYKRKQFCPIIKLKPQSFGFGHRIPICKK
jgi:NAD+ synthase (glutamine-hydrolysing)